MEFRTIIDIPHSAFQIEPHDEMLFVGSCFATEIGRRFQQEQFPTTVNPYGTMYNPASVLHTIERSLPQSPSQAGVKPTWVFITLGTNHVYREKATGEIVDNCQKRPAALFQEELLSVEVSTCYDIITLRCTSSSPSVPFVTRNTDTTRANCRRLRCSWRWRKWSTINCITSLPTKS